MSADPLIKQELIKQELVKQELALTPLGQKCLRQLMQQWFDFERRLNRVPVIMRLERGQFTVEDYRNLLRNQRQQVIEGSRWISRCASSFDRHYSDLRSVVIGHAKEEHRDYQMLEQDYVAAGGDRDEILHAGRNAGTEALHAFLMYRATQPNPVDMIGAMWIIEGLGQKMASGWAERIETTCKQPGLTTRFMRYHGDNDDEHMDQLYSMIDRACRTEEDVHNIIRTAKVTGRLYCMQLEEVDNE